MVKKNNITLYTDQQTKAKISKAAKKVGLTMASFCRSVSLQQADEILSNSEINYMQISGAK